MTAWAPYVSAIALLVVGFITSRFAGTWLVWTHGREWFRGYCAENSGRAQTDVPLRYGRLGRRAWLAGWDCSHEITPNDAAPATPAQPSDDEAAARSGGFTIHSDE